MASKLPHLAALRDRLLRRFLAKVVFGDLRLRLACRFIVAGQFQQTEIKAVEVQAIQLDAEKTPVPIGQLAGLVVQDAVFALLLLV